MAYGKIKADTLVYDNSGSDVETSISSLAAKASLPASAGTVAASEVVQVDANKDITGFRNVTLSGNLTVNGTTTTIDSTTLTVEDKNIELGKVDTPSDTTADGGGITLKGATDKTFNWVNANVAWTSSENIKIGNSKKLLIGDSSDLQIYHNGTNNYIDTVLSTADFYIRPDKDFYIMNTTSGDVHIKCIKDESVELYENNVKKLETTAAGVTVTGTVTDDKGNVRSIPSNAQGGAYVAVAADAGKAIYISTGGVTLNNSVFSAGDAVTIINNSGSDQTITQGSGVTLYNSADASSGNRTLAARGMATAWFASASVAYISGGGLS